MTDETAEDRRLNKRPEDSSVNHVSDTAVWVAAFRALRINRPYPLDFPLRSDSANAPNNDAPEDTELKRRGIDAKSRTGSPTAARLAS